MTDSLTEGKRRFQLRLPPAESQIALALGTTLLAVCLIQFESFNLKSILMVFAFFAVGILTKRAWAIWILLAALVYTLYFFIDPALGFDFVQIRFERSQYKLPTALLLMLFAAGCFRFLQTAIYRDTFFPNVELGEKPAARIKYEFPSLLGGRWWAIPVAIFLALILLRVSASSPPLRQLNIRPATSRLIFLTLLLFFSWFVSRSIIGMIVRWKMKPEQADVHCRSIVAKEFWKEAYAIESGRPKQEVDP